MSQRLCHCGSQAKVSCNQCGAALCGGGNCYRTHEKVCRPEPHTVSLHQIKAEELVSPWVILKEARRRAQPAKRAVTGKNSLYDPT